MKMNKVGNVALKSKNQVNNQIKNPRKSSRILDIA